MNTRQVDSTTPRTVVKMCGPARETLRLFALFCEQQGDIPIMEVK